MMNVPGVIGGDPDVQAKIEAARRRESRWTGTHRAFEEKGCAGT